MQGQDIVRHDSGTFATWHVALADLKTNTTRADLWLGAESYSMPRRPGIPLPAVQAAESVNEAQLI